MKKLWLTLVLILLIAPAARAELPLGGEAPYAPVQSAFSNDFYDYDDGTLSVHIEKDRVGFTNVYYAYIRLTDVSQFRTALADTPYSKAVRPVWSMARQNNAVFAMNGDYFSYQHTGIVVRSGEIIRESPVTSRDTLIINGDGDFVMLTKNTRREWEEYRDSGAQIREAFTFGPALITGGEAISFNYREKISCGYPTPAQRTVLCQTGPLEYMVFACEGPEQNKSAGLSLKEVVPLLLEKGVKEAYNLDGGSSTTLMMGETRINAPKSKFRNVSDIIYFATLCPGE